MASLTEDIRKYQAEMAKEFTERLKQAQEEDKAYKESEQYKRDCWEHHQDMWEKKAKKEGWHYTRQPYVSALDKEKQAEQAKQEEMAALRLRLKELENS